jgi:type IV pilus assembly protein PilX
MNISQQSNTRKGFIIVITLIILLVMTTMGIGMFYSTKQTAKQVSISGNRAESLYTAESCITEAVHWIEIESAKGQPCQSAGTGNLCKSIASRRMGEWELSGENTTQRNRMNAHRYRCDISLLGTISSDSDFGTGFDVGQSSSYSESDTSTKYLYKIKARADGGNNVVSEVEIIASIIL